MVWRYRIARLSHAVGVGGYYTVPTCSNDFYLPLGPLEEGWEGVSTLCRQLIIRSAIPVICYLSEAAITVQQLLRP
jgi:hypothetical protein